MQQYLTTQRQGQHELGGDLAVGGGGIDAEIREQVEVWVVEPGQGCTERCVHPRTQGQSVLATVEASDLNCTASDPHVGDLSSVELDAKTLLVEAGTAAHTRSGW